MTKLEDALARLQDRVERRKAGKGTLPPADFKPPCAAAQAAQLAQQQAPQPGAQPAQQ